MRKPTKQVEEAQPAKAPAEVRPSSLPRNRLEIIRFKTRQDLRNAFGIFREVTSSDIYFTFRKDFPDGFCSTNTATVRALQQFGVAFEWLTEGV